MSTKSPCIGVCRLENDYCRGCKRHVDEIVEWYNLSEKKKQAVIERIKNGNPHKKI
jgi:hypothetical protein